MEVRIKFDADIVIKGNTMQEVRGKFESMELWSQEAKDSHVEFSEIQLIEDADTYKDLADEYDSCYDNNEDDDEEYVCPECGHVFEQGEYNYNYDTALLDFECPECGWCGNEHEVIENDDDTGGE